jgi:predicted kinase
LIILAGLPGVGKSSIASGLARALGIPLLSIDPIEAAMWRAQIPAGATGVAAYEIAEALAEENLKMGTSVIIDAVNPVEAARAMWRRLSERHQASLTFVECFCSDLSVHRDRVERRIRGIAGMPEVTWERVQQRRAEYEPWVDHCLVLDTARSGADDLVEQLLMILDEKRPKPC